MYYLVDTNVFLHAINDNIYSVAEFCKNNNTDVTITDTILNELEPGYYLSLEDETAKQAEADELARIVKINSADDPDSIIFI